MKPPEVTLAAPTSDPDVQLMLRVRAGDADAFRELFEKHQRAIVNFAYHFVGNRHRAEEIAQDVFLQIYRDGVAEGTFRPARNERFPPLRLSTRMR